MDQEVTTVQGQQVDHLTAVVIVAVMTVVVVEIGRDQNQIVDQTHLDMTIEEDQVVMDEDPGTTRMIANKDQEVVSVEINLDKDHNLLIEKVRETIETGQDGVRVTGLHLDRQVTAEVHLDLVRAIEIKVEMDTDQDLVVEEAII